jgi:acyl carrier protein
VISERLKNVILRELNAPDMPMTGSTTAAEVPGWDSLAHVRVLAAVEREYQIRFRSLEVMKLQTVGELQALVDRKMQ